MRIKTLHQLAKAAQQRRAVIATSSAFGNPKPNSAAWVLNMPGSCILGRLNAGLIIYKPKQK